MRNQKQRKKNHSSCAQNRASDGKTSKAIKNDNTSHHL